MKMDNKRFFATFAVGAVFGAAVLLGMRGHDLDHLYLSIAQCRNDCEMLREDKNKLEAQLSKFEKTRRVRKFNILVTSAPDEFSKLSVQKEIKNKLRFLLDKELALMENNPDLFKNLLENRPLHISETQTVIVQVTSVVIGETTTLFVKAMKEVDALQEKQKNSPPTW
ncbi:MAG: hypothetical protein WCC10_09675 [Tumebacillaceae bacterium]